MKVELIPRLELKSSIEHLDPYNYMNSIRLFALFVCLFLSACSGKYEQRYADSKSFHTVNQRNKSWFPDIISEDAFNLKNNSYLDRLCAFGSFPYTNDQYYDSLFSSLRERNIDFSLFKHKVQENIKRKPDWFLEPASTNTIQCIQIGRFFIARQMKDRHIVFVLAD